MYSIKIGGSEFNDLASAANFADTKKRLILDTVRFHLVGETMTATATDSFKLVTIKRDILELSGDYANMGELLIPSTILIKASKAFKPVRNTYKDVVVTVNEDNSFTISSGSEIYGGELVTCGTYPKVETVIPSSSGIAETDQIALDPQHLAQLAKVAPFNGKDVVSRTMVIKTITDNSRPMRVESGDGRTVVVIMPVRFN